MAKFVLFAEYVNINANDLSAYGASGELTVEVADEDATTFGSGGWKEVLGGLKSAGLKVKFKQDMAAAAIDSIVWPLLGTVVSFEVRATQGVRTTSNPGYTGNLLISKWSPIAGDVGKIAEVDVEWPSSGAVARQTS
jgi:hypothetical protein